MAKLAQFLRSLVDLNGTASRKRGWLVFGLSVATILTAQAAINAGLPAAPLLLLVVAASILTIVVMVQRLHDAGRSGYWAIFSLVPLVGPLVILLLKPKRTSRRGHPIARGVVGALLICYALLGVSRAFFWQSYWIPAESMKPTLLVGDFIIATTPGNPQRGDVLVFRHPVNGSDYIKRLIGLPGDRVQLRAGVLYINDVAAPQTPNGVFTETMGPQGPMGSRPRCENGIVGDGAPCTRSRFTETLPNGVSYDVLNIETDGFADNTDVFTVPAGSYFFLGDNRDNSNDSRFAQVAGGLGFVPMENLKGRASRLLYSSAGASMLDITALRTDRFWKALP